jgi:hypothetical protein
MKEISEILESNSASLSFQMIIASLASSFRRSTFTGSTLLNSYMEKTPNGIYSNPKPHHCFRPSLFMHFWDEWTHLSSPTSQPKQT